VSETDLVHTLWLHFPKPDEYLNLNDRRYRTLHTQVKNSWNTAAWAYGTNAKRQHGPLPADRRIEILVVFGTNKPNQRRDPHNWFPTVKAIIDGFVAACLLVADDSRHVQTLEPEFSSDYKEGTVNVRFRWFD
jgi:hypothetical protein